MDPHNHKTTMSQKIFKMNLGVEAVSVYLLCCGIIDNGETITTKNLLKIWNGTMDVLQKSLSELEKSDIIRRIISDREGNEGFKLTNDKNWTCRH